MKYYAVTDDPNELLHYGVKGMKWGQHLFGDDLKPKSPAYKSAVSKLKGFMSKATKPVKVPTVKKTATQKSFEKRSKQQENFNKAVKAAQNRIKVVENLSNLDNVRNYEKKVSREYKNQQKMNRIIAKQERAEEKRALKEAKLEAKYAKNDAKMDKYLQQARHGKLKYGRLSDDQVRQITDRLGMERSARSLGSAEKTWREQKRDALRQGKLLGITKGTAAAMEEVARAGVQYGIQNWRNRRKIDKQNERDAQRQHDATRIRNKKSRSEMREDFRDEVYEQRVREGDVRRTKSLAETKRRLDDAEHKRLRERNTQDRIDSEMQLINDSEYQSALDRQREKRRKQDVQDRINSELDLLNNSEYQTALSTQREKRRKQDTQDRINNELDLLNNTEYQTALSTQREKNRKQDARDRAANELDERWQRHLEETGLSDEEARSKYFNLPSTELNSGTTSNGSVEEQRRKILDQNDRYEYGQYLAGERLKEQREQQEILEKRKERENKRIEEAEEWNKQEDERVKRETEEHDKQLAEYNKYQQLHKTSPELANIVYSNGVPVKPKKVKPPKYRDTTSTIDATTLPVLHNPTNVMNYSEWLREKYSRNQNGKKKNNGGGGNR